MKKTAMQLLADRFLLQSKGKAFTHAYRLAMKEAYQEATELLEKEREQIIVAHANGIHDASNCINGEPFKTSEGYYKDTYE